MRCAKHTHIVCVNLRRYSLLRLTWRSFREEHTKTRIQPNTIHLDYCLPFAHAGRKKIVVIHYDFYGVSSELTTTQHWDYNNIWIFQLRKCNVGGCPVPTHPVFLTTAGYIANAVLQYNRAISLSRLFTHNSCSNNQTAGLAIYVLSRIVIEFS